MKKSNTLEQQLAAEAADPSEVADLLELTTLLKTPQPRLTRNDKKQMLQTILPVDSQLPFGLSRRTLYFGATALMLLFASAITPYIRRSQPGNPLYTIRQGVEAVQNIVSPNTKEDQLLQPTPTPDGADIPTSEDDHRNSGSGSSSDDSDSQSRDSSSDDRSRGDDESQDSSSNSSNDDAEDSSNDHGSSDQSNSGSSSDHNAARDSCRDALDTRKRAGEKIDSDAYKACDSL